MTVKYELASPHYYINIDKNSGNANVLVSTRALAADEASCPGLASIWQMQVRAISAATKSDVETSLRKFPSSPVPELKSPPANWILKQVKNLLLIIR